jgi:Holliday junction resolvase
MAAEKNYENRIKKYLESKGAWFVKFFANAYTSSGIPDILCCINGRFVGIEVKQETGKPSLLQKVHLKRIGEAGGIGILAYPSGYEKLKDLIDNLSEDKNYQVEFNGEGYIEYRSEK